MILKKLFLCIPKSVCGVDEREEHSDSKAGFYKKKKKSASGRIFKLNIRSKTAHNGRKTYC